MKLPDRVLKGINEGREEIAEGRFMTLSQFEDRMRNRTLTKILDCLHKHKLSLFAKYPIRSLALFGSYAPNGAREGSDVDILVEFSQPVGFEFIDLAGELEELLQQKVDLVSKNGVKPNVWPFIEKDLIYI